MATRIATSDPIDKFRFKIILLKNNTSSITPDSAEFYAGFTSVSSPKITFNEITYRENLDGSFIKKPGIPRFEPITLNRGVTTKNEMYNWIKEIHDPAADINIYLKSLGNFEIPLVQTQTSSFRKDLIIESLDRTGVPQKYWFLFECFPTSYKPGNDFNASEDGKLIEELILTYENFVEVTATNLKDAVAKVNAMSSEAFKRSAKSALISSTTGALQGALFG